MSNIFPPITFSYDRALEIGKAAEHLVCTDLLLAGYRAFLADQGLPYDVIADVDGKLLRIQVKSVIKARNVNSQGRNKRICYSFCVRRRGKDGVKRLSDTDCDIVALVSLDIRTVAYLPIKYVAQTVYLRSTDDQLETRPNRKSWGAKITDFPFVAAIDSEFDYSFAIREWVDSRRGI